MTVMAKCDLHVHSFFSGKTNHVKLLEPRDSYNTPQRLYCKAKQRGMDLVTITDHDHIEGCLAFLDKNPDATDFFISEEVTVPMDTHRYTLHLGVYDITEADHRAIQERRRDLDALLSWLMENDVFHVWNHPFFHFPRGEAGVALLADLLERFQVFEANNGCLPTLLNQVFTEGLLAWMSLDGHRGKPVLTAGSDAHSLVRIGRTWTEADGDTPAEFLECLRRGQGTVHGGSGRFHDVFGDAMGVYLGYFRDITVRGEVHTDWSTWKKVRNGAGWIGWLPVFTLGSLLYAFGQYRVFNARGAAYRDLWRRLGQIEPPASSEEKCILTTGKGI